MVAHLLAALLSQSPTGEPQVAVVVTQRSGMSEARGEAIATKIADGLSARGVSLAGSPKESAAALAAAGTRNPAECQGKRGCVSGLARLLRVWGVVGVELADLDGTLAVHVQLVDADGERHAEVDLVMPTKRAEAEVGGQLGPFAREIVAKLDAERAVAQAKPVEPAQAVAPTPAPAEAVTEPAPAPAKRPVLPLVLTFGGAAAAAATSVAFLILAGNAKSELQQHTSTMPFTITRADAQSLVQRANDSYTVALACGIGAAALVVLGAVLGLAP